MSTATRPIVKCNQCDGAGRHELSPPNWRTYQLLGFDWHSTDAILANGPKRLKRTALLGRLNTLVRQGLAERRPNEQGRGLEWRRT